MSFKAYISVFYNGMLPFLKLTVLLKSSLLVIKIQKSYIFTMHFPSCDLVYLSLRRTVMMTVKELDPEVTLATPAGVKVCLGNRRKDWTW